MSQPAKVRPEAYLWMAIAATLFALMNFSARLASAGAHWTVVAAVRSLVGAGVAIGIARVRGSRAFVPPTRVMWLRSAFGTAAMAGSFFALTSRYMPLADAVTLNNTTPVFLAVLSPLVLRERGGLRLVFAVPAAMVGVVLVVRPPFLFGHATRLAHFANVSEVAYSAALPAEILSLTGAFFSALAMLSLRRASIQETPEAIATHFSLTAFVVHAVLALFLAPMPALTAVPPMLFAGLAAGCAQVAMTRSYGLELAARVGAFGYLQTVVAVTLGAVVLREPLSPHGALGITLIVLSGGLMALLAVRDSRRPVS